MRYPWVKLQPHSIRRWTAGGHDWRRGCGWSWSFQIQRMGSAAGKAFEREVWIWISQQCRSGAGSSGLSETHFQFILNSLYYIYIHSCSSFSLNPTESYQGGFQAWFGEHASTTFARGEARIAAGARVDDVEMKKKLKNMMQ